MFAFASVVVEGKVDGLIKGLRTAVEDEMYFLGSMRGESARFDEGHSKV